MRHEELKSSLEYQIRDPKVQKLGKIKPKQITQSVNAEDFETGVKNVDFCVHIHREFHCTGKVFLYCPYENKTLKV